MSERHRLYEQMARLGITLSDIAGMVGRSPSTIQKQLTGVNPLKDFVREAVEAAIAERTRDLDTAGANPDDSQSWGIPPAPVRDSWRAYAHVRHTRTPRETVLATVGEYLHCVEVVETLLEMYDLPDLVELKKRLLQQRRTLEAKRDGAASEPDVVIESGDVTAHIQCKTPRSSPDGAGVAGGSSDGDGSGQEVREAEDQ